MSIYLNISDCDWLNKDNFLSELPSELQSILTFEALDSCSSSLILKESTLVVEKKRSEVDGEFTLSFEKLKSLLLQRLKTTKTNNIFKRALGSNNKARQVIDLTAGFGFDAITMNFMGYSVEMIERVPEIYLINQLFLHYFKYYLNNSELHFSEKKILDRMSFEKLSYFYGEANDYLDREFTRPAVLYFDPMFAKTKTTAAPPLKAQVLRAFCGGDEDSTRMISFLLKRNWHSGLRLVSKRPIKEAPLYSKPTIQLTGKLIRYDIYIK